MGVLEPTFRSDCTVKLVDSMGDEDSIVTRARVSNKSTAEEHSEAANKGLLKALIREGHAVPLEGVVLEFYFEVPIFLSRQIVKTRISSVNEASGRYVEFIPEFYLPPLERPWVQVGKTMAYEFRENDDATRQEAQKFREHLRELNTLWYDGYRRAREAGVSKEVARMGMPVNTYTSMRVQWNLRTTLNFLALRINNPEADRVSKPQWEMDHLFARKIRDIVEEKFPTIWEAFEDSNWRKL